MRKMMECPRCGGEGVISQYGHISAGVCFRCGGSRVVPYRKPAAPKPAKVTEWHGIAEQLHSRYASQGATIENQAYWGMFAEEFGFLPRDTATDWRTAIAQCF